MPKAPVTEVKTPADRLREQLGQAEILVANMKGAGEDAVRLLELLDGIDSEYTRLSHTPLDLRPEEGRITSLHSSLRRRKAIFLRELRHSGDMKSLRAERQPAGESWWWFLDRELAAERKQKARRYGAIALGLVALLIVGIVIYRQFFRPDPLVIEVYTNQNLAMDEVMLGNYAKAIPYLERNMELEPAEAEWPIRLGVLEEIAGNTTRSQALFELGEERSESEAGFYLLRAQAYSEAGHYEQTLQDAERAVQLDASLPMGYLLLGRSPRQPGTQSRSHRRV